MQQAPLKLSLAVGATPQALPLKNRQVGVGSIDLDIVPNEKVYPLFRPMVREQTFDICEMAVVTYNMAHDRKKPISLVPALMLAWESHRTSSVTYPGERSRRRRSRASAWGCAPTRKPRAAGIVDFCRTISVSTCPGSNGSRSKRSKA